MTKEFDEKIQEIHGVVEKEIKDGKREESDREGRTERIISYFDEKYPGLLEHYNETKIKKKSKKKKKTNEKPKAKASKPKRKLPDEAEQWIKTWSDKKDVSEDNLIKDFWEKYDENDHLDEETRVEFSLISLLSKLSSQMSGQSIGYKFIPIDITKHYSFPGKKWEAIEGTDRKKEVSVTMHRGAIYGIFTDNKNVESFGSVTAWDKDTAKCIDDLEIFHPYSGKFDGYIKDGLYQLNLNNVQEFEELDDNISKEKIIKKCVEYISTSQVGIWTISDFADPEAFDIGGKEIIIKGLVSRKTPLKVKNGENQGGIILTPSELGIPNDEIIYFYSDAEKLSDIKAGDIVYVRSYTNRNKDGIRHNGKWVLPITHLDLPTPTPKAEV